MIRYTQKWDYHYQHTVTIIEDGIYIASGYISENSDDVTITGVYVDDKHRGKGYGRMIIEELMKWIEELGFNEIWLMVKKSNIRALKMYQKYGFSVEKDAGHGAYSWMKWNKKTKE